MIETLVIKILPPTLSAIVAAWCGWFFARRNINAEVELKLAEAELKKAEANKINNEAIMDQFKTLQADLTKTKENLSQMELARKQDNIVIVNVLSMLCGDMQCLRRARVEVEYINGSIRLKKNSESEDSNPLTCVENHEDS